MNWEDIIEQWKRERYNKAFEPEVPFQDWVKTKYEPPKKIKQKQYGNISAVPEKVR